MLNIKLSFGTKRFLKYGTPMFIFMLAGSYGLSEFTDLRVKQREENSRFLTAEESKKFLKQDKKPVESLDSMLEKMNDKVNIEKWEQVRGPRIWEEETLKILPSYNKKKDE